MPGFKELYKKQIVKNYVLRKIERKHEATVSLLGDPSIVTSKVYRFDGLSDRDSGNWYATKVTHKISVANGYITSMELIRKPIKVNLQFLKRETKIKVTGSIPNTDVKTSEEIKTTYNENKVNKSNDNKKQDTNNLAAQKTRTEKLQLEQSIISNPANKKYLKQ